MQGGYSMSHILVVTGSVRPNSVNEKIVAYVVNALKEQDVQTTIADLKELDLPFFNDQNPPSSPDFAPTNAAVKRWTDMVGSASGVVLVTPEYNHTMSPVQLNAVDWVYKEWHGKPVALVGYGWRSGAGQAQATAREALAVNLKAEVLDTQTNLFFMKDLQPDGTIADEAAVAQKIGATLDELLTAVGK